MGPILALYLYRSKSLTWNKKKNFNNIVLFNSINVTAKMPLWLNVGQVWFFIYVIFSKKMWYNAWRDIVNAYNYLTRNDLENVCFSLNDEKAMLEPYDEFLWGYLNVKSWHKNYLNKTFWHWSLPELNPVNVIFLILFK